MVGTDDSTELWRPPKLTAIIGGVDATFIPLPWTDNSIVVPIWELEPTTVNSFFFLLFSLTLFHSERHYHRHKVLIRRSDLEHFNLSLSLVTPKSTFVCLSYQVSKLAICLLYVWQLTMSIPLVSILIILVHKGVCLTYTISLVCLPILTFLYQIPF